ncbi:unnamed protein product [Vitrella brassicaformis CCMP3155]|uniref:Galactokinase n=2 Tax=Vitrella brassicaformis TaxID=1169539 RepID=A0A0G4GLG1_VITBC|nr:unnamed protein product [Vitrella brassicaformis CCMP3155]|eukprot:CEM30970.1 unnamed protein product [Vitrella brassicaformis CCMP3155]
MPAGQEDGVLRIGKRFVEIHGRQPHCIALAPGRVNLIGEHIDYNGYSVLPIATNHTVRVATSIDTHANSSLRREDNDDAGAAAAMVDITIAHADGEQGGHPARRITKHKHTGVPLDWSGEFASGPHWTNYVLAGILCWSDTDAMSDESSSIEIGVLVDGDIPQAAGLSSSSALVVASALATLSLHPSPPSLTCTHIAELCTHTERRVGTAGGGMDQSAIMCCRRGAALHVQFSPLRVSVVPLPTSRVVFVVAHSLVESPKAVQAATHYNKRVFECSLALAILDEAVGGFLGADDVVRSTLADFQRSRQLCHDGCRSLVRQHIREEAYTKVARQGEVSSVLGQERLDALLRRVGRDVWTLNHTFQPHKRALHVFGEAARVAEFLQLAEGPQRDTDATIVRLGELMNASDESMRDLYECGCPELTALTSICRKVAIGSRVTGAGWGGCTVSMVWSGDAQRFIETVKEGYYEPLMRERATASVGDDLGRYVFVVDPAEGAQLHMRERGDHAGGEGGWTPVELRD